MKKSCLFTIALLSLASLVGCNTGGGDVKVTGITTNEAAFSIEVGESHDFDYKVAPDDATDKTVTFSVKSGEDYVDVSGSKVTGKAAGVASVEGVTKDGGFKVTYTVTVVPAPQKLDFKAEVAEFYGDDLPEDFDLPKFVVASEDAELEIDDEDADYGYLYVYVYEATADEYAAYLSSLEVAGWVDNGEMDDLSTLRFKDSGACLFHDYFPADEQYSACAGFGFYWEEPPLKDFPVDAVKDFYGDDLPEDFNLPVYNVASEDAVFEVDDSMAGWGYFFVYVDEATADEHAAYVAKLVNADWVVEAESDGDYILRFKDSGVCLNIVYCPAYEEDPAYDALMFYWEELPSTDWPGEAMDKEFISLGISDRLPEFSGDALGYEYYSGEGLYGFSRYIYIDVEEGSEAAAVAIYKEDLLAAGFVEAGEDIYGDMHYISIGYELEVCPYDNTMYGGEGVIVDIYALFPNEAYLAGFIASNFFDDDAYDYVEAGDEAVYYGDGQYGPGASFDSVFFNTAEDGAHISLDDFLYTIGYIEPEEEGEDPEAPIMTYIINAFIEAGEYFMNMTSYYGEEDELFDEGGEVYLKTEDYIAGIYALVLVSDEGEFAGAYMIIVEVDILEFTRAELEDMGDDGQAIIDAGIYFDDEDVCKLALASVTVSYTAE